LLALAALRKGSPSERWWKEEKKGSSEGIYDTLDEKRGIVLELYLDPESISSPSPETFAREGRKTSS